MIRLLPFLFLFSCAHEQVDVSGLGGFQITVDELPQVQSVNARRMAEVAFNGSLPASVSPESLEIYGLYHHHERNIYLLDTIDLNTDYGKGILLHELVHYLQYKYGLDLLVEHKNDLEKLAYQIEKEFIENPNQLRLRRREEEMEVIQ